jgi:hypothetical protein
MPELTRPRTSFDTLNHECGHAAVGWFLGLKLREVRVDRPGVDDYAGLVTIEAARPYEALLFILGGPCGENAPLRWRPRHDVPGDEGIAAGLIGQLGLDEDGWNDATAIVEDILRRTRKAGRALSWALYDQPVLSGDEAERIMREASSSRSRPTETCWRGCWPTLANALHNGHSASVVPRVDAVQSCGMRSRTGAARSQLAAATFRAPRTTVGT